MARKGRKNSMENYKMVKLLAFCVWKSSFFLLQIVMISEITIKNCFMLLVVHLNPIIYERFNIFGRLEFAWESSRFMRDCLETRLNYYLAV